MNRTFASIVALFGFSIVTLSAQGKAPDRVELRMLAFGPELQFQEAFAHDPAGDPDAASVPAPVKTFLNHEFAAVLLKTRKVAITAKPDRASLTREGELIGEVTLPEKVKSAVLVFLPNKPGGKAKCQIMVIDDSRRAFPAGSYHITNLSPMPVRLTLERKNYDFVPGKTLLINDPPARENRMIGMRAFVVKDNQLVPISAGLWPHPGNSRGVKVLFQDPASGTIQLRAFDDVPPRVPAQTAPATVQTS